MSIANPQEAAPVVEEPDYEALPETASWGIHAFAGALAGISEHAFMYPVDSIKTRMQVIQTSPTSSKALAYSSVNSAFNRVSSTEGLRSLWRGVSSVVIGAGPAHAVYFGVYEAMKDLSGGNREGHQVLPTALAGASATIAADALMNPFDVIKQRMQVEDSKFKTVRSCARTLLKTEGLSAFYVSYPTTLMMTVPFTAVQFSTYESTKKILNPQNNYSPVSHGVSGAAAGAVAALLTTPLDVAKTVLQTRGNAPVEDMRVVRWTALATGVVYGAVHLRSVHKIQAQEEEHLAEKHHQQVIEKARKAWIEKKPSKSSNGLITDPENPSFDLEKFLEAKSKEN
ncbi:hypothetical protein E3P92_03156 [Wallemia ichthyophaga]|uniref:Uncharacterized protein n=1 Tax=Wallemia ichthyophaga TaxID=245174 RepID=A0A4V4M8W2_WALIC|nr:hypothetical protein E3P91_03713 [Wallemia ichthyophaga]TIA79653.1 hypothetical protein E3P98_03158 [Wallemia ichthyophaga]TIA88871.1 hypothetical protein E3P97_03330 [Wallemia ichthyophaga]TIB02967.1 hypothetical protein E3P96_02006 [Wallemia ichthyophaga]TIB10573.1 hypothetical protein E3P92_03156 [Wallemia ichthyophaga]